MTPERATIGEKLADGVANIIGSWSFVTTQLVVIAIWAGINVIPKDKIDPFPFQFLNLVLGVQSALTGPMLLIAGKRQEQLDRQRAIENLRVDQDSYQDLRQLVATLREISERNEKQFKHLDHDLEELTKEVDFS